MGVDGRLRIGDKSSAKAEAEVTEVKPKSPLAPVAKALMEKQQERLNAFFAAHGFAGVNARKKKLLKSYYPLHLAVEQNNIEIVRLLIAARANMSLKNSAGRPPLQMASRIDKQG